MNELGNDLKRNQYLLLFYFLYTVFNGALRKWVLVGNSGVNNVLLLVQMLFPFLLVIMMKREKTVWSFQPVVPYILVLVVLALNPINASVFHGVFGIVLHLGFWFIMITYLNEREAFPLEKLIMPIIAVCIIESLLTFVQFTFPPTHVINRYESAETEVSGFEGNIVRVIGTFSYISGYGSFLFFFGLFIWALMVENKQYIVVIYGLAGMGIVSAFMNGSRAVVLPLILSVIFGFLNYGSMVQKVKAVTVIASLAGLFMLYDVGKQAVFIENAYNAFSNRVKAGQSQGEASHRAYDTFAEIVDFRGNNPLFGIGLGATYQGAISLWGRSPELKKYGFYEEEPERIILEGGFFLFLIRIGLFVFLIQRSEIPIIFSIPILFFLFFYTHLVFNTSQTAFTFLGIALLDKLYFLKKQEQESFET